jgi:hypothetical protein
MSFCLHYCDCLEALQRFSRWACPPLPSLYIPHAPSEHQQYAPVSRDETITRAYFGTRTRTSWRPSTSMTSSSPPTPHPHPIVDDDATTRHSSLSSYETKHSSPVSLSRHNNTQQTNNSSLDHSSSIPMTRLDRALSLDDDDHTD